MIFLQWSITNLNVCRLVLVVILEFRITLLSVFPLYSWVAESSQVVIKITGFYARMIKWTRSSMWWCSNCTVHTLYDWRIIDVRLVTLTRGEKGQNRQLHKTPQISSASPNSSASTVYKAKVSKPYSLFWPSCSKISKNAFNGTILWFMF